MKYFLIQSRKIQFKFKMKFKERLMVSEDSLLRYRR